MLPKQVHCSRRCSQSMGFLKLSDLTMAHNLPAINLPSLLRSGTFDHTTSSPRNPRSNGEAEATVKVTKGLLTHAKYSGQDSYLALLAYRSTPIDAHLHSPPEMLYQRVVRTTVPQRIRHKDAQAAPDWDHLNDHATQSAAYHDHHCKQKSPLYAGQTVSVLNDAKTLWLPATVICQAKHGSFMVQVIGGGQYRRACDHIHEHHPDAIKPDRSTIADVAPATPECSPGMPPVRPAPATPVAAPVLEEMWPGTTPEDVPDVMLTQTAPGWWTFNIMADEHYKHFNDHITHCTFCFRSYLDIVSPIANHRRCKSCGQWKMQSKEHITRRQSQQVWRTCRSILLADGPVLTMSYICYICKLRYYFRDASRTQVFTHFCTNCSFLKNVTQR